MALDRNARDLRSLRVLLHDRGWANLEEAIDGPERKRLLAEGIQHFARTKHLSESDRLLLTLAYSLWRGFGPSIDVHALWGMDPAVASKVLASLAVAVDPGGAADVLRQSIALLEGVEPADAPTEETPRPMLAVARE
jgi:hypothetical protein